MKKFIVDEEVFNLIPDLHIGVLVLKNVNEKKELNESDASFIKNLLDNANKDAKKYVPNEPISENEVVKVWREVYQKFPTKKGARCSVENLLKRVLHDNPVGSILPSIDITNAISLKYAFPIGAEDAGKFEGDLHLGIMSGNEYYLAHGEDKEEPPLAGEVAYADEGGVVCRCLNWRDALRTEITDDTTYEFIAMECVDGRIDDLKSAMSELKDLMTKYLDAEVINTGVVTKENSEITIE